MGETPGSEQLSNIIVVFSVLIAIFGTVANSLSLSYFFSLIKSKDTTRNSDSSSTKLFAALNISDLLVSVSSAFEFLLIMFVYNVAPSEVFRTTLCMISVLMTGFLTCLLAVVRVIHLVSPLCIIDWRAINVCITVYSVTVVALRISLRVFKSQKSSYDATSAIEAINGIEFFVIASMFLIVVLVNVITLVYLHSSQLSHSETRDVKRKATITVAIISAIYCLCNVGSVVIFGAMLSKNYNNVIPDRLVHVSYYILLPLNSACNPVVYLMRKEEMRSHVRTLWRRTADKLTGLFLSKARDDNLGLELQISD